MATLKQIRRRIRSVQSTMQITKAMEMVAAAKLRKAQARAEAARPYAAAMEEALRRLTGAARELAHPLFAGREPQRVLLAVVTSDKGLCGAFNTHILHAAEARIRALGPSRLALMPIGRRANQYFDYRGRATFDAVEQLGDQIDLALVTTLARRFTERFLAGEIDRVEFLYTRFITTARRRVERQTVIPITPQTTEPAAGRPYIFEPDAERVLAALLPRYVTTRILSILADSLAAEHSARMLAMGNATRNADEMISTLTLTANKLRQAAITRELTEIVGGAAGVA